MSSPVISVEHLSKAYRIGVKEEIPDTLMGAMKNVITAPWKNFKALRRLNTSTDSPILSPQSPVPASLPDSDTLWALRDVSFEINQGEVVGIIGRNGAGKSTLLKILSRITEPTSGRVVIRGRVSSLLEVGTGFHPELTGRENVYMNGTILGMSKNEIDRKFDEIVDFSGVERFLDTPTKRYSSGMQVRLAFAVAAHLEPEILIVDEVLAVGDAEFQKKCIGKMQDVANGGRTILFVSHNMAAIESLCERGIHLANGKLLFEGKSDDTIANYNTESSTRRVTEYFPENQNQILRSVSVRGKSFKEQTEIREGEGLEVAIQINTCEFIRGMRLVLGIENELRQRMLSLVCSTDAIGEDTWTESAEITCIVENVPLAYGLYGIILVFWKNNEIIEAHYNELTLEIQPNPIFYTSGMSKKGLCVASSRWCIGGHSIT